MQLRITKYNPAYRDKDGHFRKDDWTGVGDIGNIYDGKILTEEEYRQTESNYWNAYERLLQGCSIPYMQVKNLSICNFPERELLRSITEESLFFFSKILPLMDGENVHGQRLEYLFKLALRECLGCRLFGPNNSYIHWGYDYYTFWGCDIDIDYGFIKNSGLYAEDYESPFSSTGWDELTGSELEKCIEVKEQENRQNINKITQLMSMRKLCCKAEAKPIK